MLNIGGALIAQNPQKALPYFQETLSNAISLNDTHLQIHAYRAIGLVFILLGKFSDSMTFLKKALSLTQDGSYSYLRLLVLSALTTLCSRSSNKDEGEKYFFLGMALADTVGVEFVKLDLLDELGHLYVNLEMFSKSKEHLEQAMELLNKYSNSLPNQGSIFNQLGRIRCVEGNFKEGLSYFEKSLEISKQIGARTITVGWKLHFALALENIDPIRSISLLEECVEIKESIGHALAAQYRHHLEDLRSKS
ncbi:MAG: hypothetical protein AAF490_15105 [Chloroflexota bacterium]